MQLFLYKIFTALDGIPSEDGHIAFNWFVNMMRANFAFWWGKITFWCIIKQNKENYYEFKPISIWRVNVNKFCVEYYPDLLPPVLQIQLYLIYLY